MEALPFKDLPFKDLAFDIESLHRAYAAGLTPAQVVDIVYARIAAAADPGIFITLMNPAEARKAAHALGGFDRTRPLWGIPVAIKDNIDVAGVPTTAGCPGFASTPTTDAAAVERLRAAGAIVIGKTNLDQFATGLVGLRTPYPAPRNAFDAAIVPGGSSSGSGVAVARGLVTLALGTDTAGSGRVPAGLNNIVGLKPSVGAISMRGVVPACRTLDVVSVFATTVDCAWAAFAVMAGPDAADPFSRPVAVGALGPAPPAFCIGVPQPQDLEFFGDAAAGEAWERAVDALRRIGAKVIDIDMSAFLAVAQMLYEGPWMAERYASVGKFIAKNPAAIHPVMRAVIAAAVQYTAVDAFEGLYALTALRQQTAPVWQQIDALAVPTVPCVVRVSDVKADPYAPNARLGRWTNFVNLLDLAALAVPGPFRTDGLPAGVTLIGPRGSDAALASFGRAFHASLDIPIGATGHPLPKLRELAAPEDDLIEIVVVGAHLSGMPLNAQLRSVGARFRRAAATETSYKLYALAGEAPRRPGLLRITDNTGHAIATEVWALPANAFGQFVASIPPPLAIGTIRLADGTRPKGFLVEPEGLAGAEDISRFGGWRSFVAAAAA